MGSEKRDKNMKNLPVGEFGSFLELTAFEINLIVNRESD
jgi:hypothetical protein